MKRGIGQGLQVVQWLNSAIKAWEPQPPLAPQPTPTPHTHTHAGTPLGRGLKGKAVKRFMPFLWEGKWPHSSSELTQSYTTTRLGHRQRPWCAAQVIFLPKCLKVAVSGWNPFREPTRRHRQAAIHCRELLKSSGLLCLRQAAGAWKHAACRLPSHASRVFPFLKHWSRPLV